MTRWFRAEGRRRPRAEARRAFDALAALAGAAFGDGDILLTPTTPVFPPEVGAFSGLPPEETFRAAAPLGAFTAAWNITGQPAATLPWGTGPGGLPIGIQLVARSGGDGIVLALARELEAERGRRGEPPA